MFNHIVVGFDGSEHSEHALRTACHIAEKFDGDVHVSHTPKHETVSFALGAVAGYHVATSMPKPEDIKAAAEKIFEQARAVAASCGDIQITTHQGDGDPAHDMLKCADDCRADLIVTGRRGLGNLGALMMGSTSQHVAHHAKCACMTVM